MITFTMDNRTLEVPEETTLLKAARMINIKIPTLCYHDDLCLAGNCRVCLVEVEGMRTLQASCSTYALEGMVVHTNSRKVRKARQDIINLLISEHNTDCLHCYKNSHCELQDLAREYALTENPFIDLKKNYLPDISSPAIHKDDSKCIRCQRCVRTCVEIQGVSALAVVNRGADLRISTFLDYPLDQVVCTNCGQCVNRCPTGALTENSYIEKVWEALDDGEKTVVVQTAPAVRVALGEYLGFAPGERVTGKLVTALKRIGFDAVFDTDFTADLTIVEEGTELLTRLKKKVVDGDNIPLPMLTSCSPGWIKYIEHEFPHMLNNLSTCKSPQQMFGALAKTYYAEQASIDPAKLVVVSIMPCTAKKFEAQRPEMRDSGYQDVDYVLTTRELALMIEQSGLEFMTLADSAYDTLLGSSTGAAALFGATGGVMEAALRTAYELVTGRDVPFEDLNISPVRGMDGVKEASITIENPLSEWSFLNNVELKVAVAHGLGNARKVLRSVDEGKSFYHFIEIMACPGGCLGGGGQPIPTTPEIRQKRMDAVYSEDMAMSVRKSHENPELQELYRVFLKEPGSETSHHLLHTGYVRRSK
ncbi:NADH-dependent [FeFe] hydrogenase, group A6 [Spirochaeta isovalerica]|uniref:Iron-only hydrogenase group A n=1 Tax=Spirochaeta isovalerica TaxID=150 RepID=A0A841RD80_9SPIO|nr:NADH-dependent [FeFe] hydrogenase, group A6 [Spirochaeta isovalerica]MBB6480342.1 iron-only hydrogenase group A [Spirochaeta isovalerica]